MREKKRDLTQSYGKIPYTIKNKKSKVTPQRHHKNHRNHNDYGPT